MKQCPYCGERYHENDIDAIQHICTTKEEMTNFEKPKKTDEELIELMVEAWNNAPVKANGHLIANRFEHEQMRAALAVVRESGRSIQNKTEDWWCPGCGVGRFIEHDPGCDGGLS